MAEVGREVPGVRKAASWRAREVPDILAVPALFSVGKSGTEGTIRGQHSRKTGNSFYLSAEYIYMCASVSKNRLLNALISQHFANLTPCNE